MLLALGLLQVAVGPAGAAAQTPQATPTPTRPAAAPTFSPPPATAAPGPPSSPAGAAADGAGVGGEVPVTGLTPGPDGGTGQTRLTLVLFDGDIVLVGGRGFTPGQEVTITAETTDLGGSATANAGADGRFILGFQVPAGFADTVRVTAVQGPLQASGELEVVTEGALPPAEPAEQPEVPAVAGAAAAPSGLDTRGTLSGLPWMSGVYNSHQLSQVMAFGNWRGRPLDFAHVFTVRGEGWEPIVQPHWPFDDFKDFPGRLLVSQPTFPKGQGNNAACARGEYDEHWKRFGRFLVEKGRPDTIVRIGWEFNGLFMYWHSDPEGTVFAECFRRIATAIRSTNPDVLIDWSFNAHNSPVPKGNSPWAAYPGDEYVDFVGIDPYDWYPASKDEATWTRQCEDPNGLCYLMKFAREHGKKVGVGEWGVASCNPNGGGDNPFYINKMYETFMANQDVMGYEAYFHDAAPGNVCSTIMNGGQNPNSSAVYKRLFGTAT